MDFLIFMGIVACVVFGAAAFVGIIGGWTYIING